MQGDGVGVAVEHEGFAFIGAGAANDGDHRRPIRDFFDPVGFDGAVVQPGGYVLCDGGFAGGVCAGAWGGGVDLDEGLG